MQLHFATTFTPDRNFSIWEDCDAGNLNGIMMRNKEQYFPEAFCWHVFQGLAAAILWLHTGHKIDESSDALQDELFTPPDMDWHAILHKSINPTNVFFKRNMDEQMNPQSFYPSVKLGGFRLASVLQHEGCDAPIEVNLIDEHPPEIRAGGYPQIYTAASDIWQLGALIHAPATGSSPWCKNQKGLADWQEKCKQLAPVPPRDWEDHPEGPQAQDPRERHESRIWNDSRCPPLATLPEYPNPTSELYAIDSTKPEDFHEGFKLILYDCLRISPSDRSDAPFLALALRQAKRHWEGTMEAGRDFMAAEDRLKVHHIYDTSRQDNAKGREMAGWIGKVIASESRQVGHARRDLGRQVLLLQLEPKELEEEKE